MARVFLPSERNRKGARSRHGCKALFAVLYGVFGEPKMIRNYKLKGNDIVNAEGVAIYIHEATNAENRADRLAVIADALAEEIEGLLLSCSDDLESANYWCDRASRAEAKLQELIDEFDRIANDYIPDNDKMAPLALEEMRGAIGAALTTAKEGWK